MQKIVTRHYNQIKIDGDKIIKRGPEDRMAREIAWLRAAKEYIPDNVPEAHRIRKGSYEMERIDGSNVYQWALAQRNSTNVASAMERLFHLVRDRLHKRKMESKRNDIKSMYYLKPKSALERFVEDNAVDFDNLVINGKRMRNPLVLLQEIYSGLEAELRDTKYSLIHGDLTWSNTLIDDKLNFYFIDPRGCFGDTELYGDIRYDVAKMYYSIAGDFDSLNAGRFTHHLDGHGHTYSIDSTNHHHLSELLLEAFGERKEIIEFIHATIWLSLLAHVDNEQQRYAAFCQGVSLINKLRPEDIVKEESLASLRGAINQASRRLSMNDRTEAIWVGFGSFAVNNQKKGSDLDLMCISDGFAKPARHVFRYKKTSVHLLLIPTKEYIKDGSERLYGGYLVGKVINPHVLLYGNKRLATLLTRYAGEYIGEFAGFLGGLVRDDSYGKSGITAQAFIAFLSTCPSFDSYLLEYFVSPDFPELWESMCNSTVTNLKSAEAISGDGRKFRYLRGFKSYDEFHKERMKCCARHWSFGAVCHGNDHTFQDWYFANAQRKINRIDPDGKEYKKMISFLKRESGLNDVFI